MLLDDESKNLDNKFEDVVKVPQENYKNEHDEPSEFDDDICVNESDEEDAAEVQEFNNNRDTECEPRGTEEYPRVQYQWEYRGDETVQTCWCREGQTLHSDEETQCDDPGGGK